MGKPKTPDVPDPAETAETEARVNRITQITPSGNVRYGTIGTDGSFAPGTGDADGPQYAVRVEETPFQSAIRGIAEPAARDFASDVAASMPTGGAPRLDDYDPGNLGQLIFNNQMQYAREDFARQREDRDTVLQSRGIPLGSEAYNESVQQMNRDQNEYIGGAARSAEIAGRSEQERLYRIAEGERAARINELFGLTGGSYDTRASTGVPGTPLIDVSGMTQQQYAAQMQNAQIEGQNRSGAFQTIGGLGAALLMCSRDVKEDLGSYDGLPEVELRRWRYHGDDVVHAGPYSEDFQDATGLGSRDGIHPSDLFAVAMSHINSLTARIKALEGAAAR